MADLKTSAIVPIWLRDATGLHHYPSDWAKLTISNQVENGSRDSSFMVQLDVLMPGSHSGPVTFWVTRLDLLNALERTK